MSSTFFNTLVYKYKGKFKHIGSQHPIIRQIKHIQNNTSDDSEKRFLAEGIWAHQRLVAANFKILSFLICPN